MKEFDKSFDLKVEGFKKHKGKELQFVEIEKKRLPKKHSHKHFYNITICIKEQ